MAASSSRSLDTLPPVRDGKGKQHNRSLGALSTLDAFDDCVSDSDSDTLVVSSDGGMEATEMDLEAKVGELDDPEEVARMQLLRSLGFTDAPMSEPLLPLPSVAPRTSSTQPPPYLNFFWRQYQASRQEPRKLTAAQLEQSNASFESKVDRPGNAGEWLWNFKAMAKSMPVKSLVACVLGDDLGPDVASFVGADGLATSSELSAATLDACDAPYGQHVLGSMRFRLPASPDSGRAGFLLEEEVSIPTPGSSWPSYGISGSAAVSEAGDETGGSWWLAPPDVDCPDMEEFGVAR
mmetsp:Transcript_118012/g.328904  ORF Transcript_118012/g.328904 Transcript_118012/m.328904 type:complete len:293 (-) Transcript_118012:99-977(-)|eukprot:CAMPEP_0179080512 /NCGR_PEP_ID=MMETSP0796-20121207/36190_1 /TAXON_ID=73915 /ORGANISM="Pyrodinium bahamense, Strain pbaha01" /LENGTH=292 /DNA_ID=CAMNT_0020777869 /DNA_START=110 /DNA_END=988 /DNA_ORIENTATION=+